MSEFIRFCNKIAPLDQDAGRDLMEKCQSKTFIKGEDLLRHGEICRHLYFIEEGLTKTYFYRDGKEIVMRFFSERNMFTVLDSFLRQTPSRFMMAALEPTRVTCIRQEDLEELCKKHHCIETFFRKLLAFATVQMMKRISEMMEENATQRYNHFIADHNALLQRISLGDLACYLGITQVSLSRIRAKK